MTGPVRDAPPTLSGRGTFDGRITPPADRTRDGAVKGGAYAGSHSPPRQGTRAGRMRTTGARRLSPLPDGGSARTRQHPRGGRRSTATAAPDPNPRPRASRWSLSRGDPCRPTLAQFCAGGGAILAETALRSTAARPLMDRNLYVTPSPAPTPSSDRRTPGPSTAAEGFRRIGRKRADGERRRSRPGRPAPRPRVETWAGCRDVCTWYATR